jgi:hypothetical protein
MTANQYRATIETLGLTQVGAARILGVDERTSRKWALGERPVPATVSGFLTYLCETRRTPAFARLMAE